MPTGVRLATEPVFHYTSSGGLIGILETKRLRASEASGMNDLAEVKSGWGTIKDWLAGQGEPKAIDLLQDLAENPRRRPHEVFVLCGFLLPDDANQWRLYANGGGGYAIELDPSVHLVAFSEHPASEDDPTYGLRARDVAEVSPWLHVMYDDSEVVAALEEIVASVEDRLLEIEAKREDEYRDHLSEQLEGDTYEALATVAHLRKSVGFSGENEVRVVTTFFWGNSNINYRPGAYGVVGYADLTATSAGEATSRVLRPRPDGTSPETTLPVVSIRLGPLLDDGNTKTIESLLRSNGFRKAPVSTSDVPLR